jgi:hypothetical protein
VHQASSGKKMPTKPVEFNVECRTAPARLQSRSKNLVDMQPVDQVEDCSTASERSLALQRAFQATYMQLTKSKSVDTIEHQL